MALGREGPSRGDRAAPRGSPPCRTKPAPPARAAENLLLAFAVGQPVRAAPAGGVVVAAAAADLAPAPAAVDEAGAGGSEPPPPLGRPAGA